MGPQTHFNHRWLIATLFIFLLLFFSANSAIPTLTPQPITRGGDEAQVKAEREEKRIGGGGPGSWPPSCRGKCGWCNPCEAVHVPVQPGFIIRLEYYPEAWRCKCGNKLFTP